eukprot:15198-Heterococcus_DN1.PRE.2
MHTRVLDVVVCLLYATGYTVQVAVKGEGGSTVHACCSDADAAAALAEQCNVQKCDGHQQQEGGSGVLFEDCDTMLLAVCEQQVAVLRAGLFTVFLQCQKLCNHRHQFEGRKSNAAALSFSRHAAKSYNALHGLCCYYCA